MSTKQNRSTFEIKTECYVELLMSKTMEFLRSNNMPHLNNY